MGLAETWLDEERCHDRPHLHYLYKFTFLFTVIGTADWKAKSCWRSVCKASQLSLKTTEAVFRKYQLRNSNNDKKSKATRKKVTKELFKALKNGGRRPKLVQIFTSVRGTWTSYRSYTVDKLECLQINGFRIFIFGYFGGKYGIV